MPPSHCHHHCHGCPASFGRRNFLKGGAAALALSGMSISLRAQNETAAPKPRVAVFFLSDPKPNENWPWPGWNPEPREKELTDKLVKGCPDVEFVFFSSRLNTVQAGLQEKDRVDGVIAYLMTLGGSGAAARQVAEWGKPMILANYILGGCAPFLQITTWASEAKKPVVSVSSSRDEDLVAVARCLAQVKRKGLTAEQFAAEAWDVYRKTYRAPGEQKCAEDAPKLSSIADVLKRIQESRILVVGARDKPGSEANYFGAKVTHVGFDEFSDLCKEVDADAANAKAEQWMKAARKIVEAQPEAIRASARVALATRKLLEKYKSDTVTMNCLGGFSAGKLSAYPCLGFTELLDEGKHGVCEAQIQDAFAMVVCRVLTGRAGFVSDPTLDTATNHIIYAHCMAPTKMLGSDRPSSPFHIRTLHNRDPRGACVQSFMPEGYMTTSFRIMGKYLVMHQAKSAGNYDSERGCRSQLVGEVKGDIEKLMKHWQAWHRVTVYGDVKEPLKELATALKLTVFEEA
ncbi:MAG: hypothetical protein NTX50_09100 [Candidatus Sumerlaeota bacterium]|nr:hypothetical protein [Candidatus Sumerlaeota bacterium]